MAVLHRPGNEWPLLLGARLAGGRAPDRHWPDRPELVGVADAAEGSRLAVNDWGVAAALTGPEGKATAPRSRGELVLDALDHADAAAAAEALAHLEPRSWRPFQLVVGDARDLFRIASDMRSITVERLPSGLSTIDVLDWRAAPPDPDREEWSAWLAALGGAPAGLVAVPASIKAERRPKLLFTADRVL